MCAAKGFDDLFNDGTRRIALAQGRTARPANLPASTSRMRAHTSHLDPKMGAKSASRHSWASLALSAPALRRGAAPITSLRGRTSYAEKGVQAGGLGSFVDAYAPPLAPPRGCPGGGCQRRQPAPPTRMRRHTSMTLDGGFR